MDMNTVAGVLGLLTGVVGIWLTIYYARQSKRLESRLRRLTWSDLQMAAAALLAQIKKRNFKPDAILALGPRGAMVGHMMLLELKTDIPMIVAVSYLHDRSGQKFPDPPEKDWLIAQTNRSQVLIPRCVLQLKMKRLIVVDDWVLSGDMMEAVRGLLMRELDGVRLITCTVAASTGAIRNGKAPDYFVWTVEGESTYFPWGPAR